MSTVQFTSIVIQCPMSASSYKPPGGKMKYRNQTGRVYKAERITSLVKHNEEFTLKQCQQFVDDICKRVYIRKHYPIAHAKIFVLDGRRRRSACATTRDGYRVICLPRWARNRYVILHELAHHFTEYGHNHIFADCLLDLVRNIMGKEPARLLQAGFHVTGVKIIGKNGPTKARCPKEMQEWVIQYREGIKSK